MPNMGGVLKVRLPLERLAEVDRAAAAVGLTRSLWVRRVLHLALVDPGRVPEVSFPIAHPVPVVEAPTAEPEAVPSVPAPVQQTQVNDKVQRMYRNQGRQI